MNNRKNRTALIIQPLIIFLCSAVILWISCTSFVTMCAEMFQSALIQGELGYKENFGKFHKIDAEKKEGSNQGGVTIPEYGAKYAAVEIENYDISIPLYYGDDREILKLGAGQYANKIIPGKKGTILIGGHDMTYFKNLDKLNKDDVIIIKTEYGKYQYKVSDMAVLSVEQAAERSQNYQGVILYTCYPIGNATESKRRRYLVFCTPQEEVHNEK